MEEHGKRKLYIQKEGEKFRQELDVPNLEKGENKQTSICAKRTKQKLNTELEISYQSNGRKKLSMAITQRELRKQMLTKIRPTNGSEALA